MKKFSSKITLMIVAFIFISIVSISLLFCLGAKSIIMHNSEDNLLGVLNANATIMEAQLERVVQLSKQLESIVLSNIDLASVTNDSSAMQQFNDHILGEFYGVILGSSCKSGWVVFDSEAIKGGHLISFHEENGKLVRSAEYDVRAGGFSNEDWWTKAYKNGEAWAGPYYWAPWKKNVIIYSRRLKKDGKVIGLVGSTFYMDDMRAEISKLRVFDSGYYLLMDSDFNMIYNPDRQVRNLRSDNDGQLAKLADAVSRSDKKTDLMYYKDNGSDKIMAYTKLSNGWILATFSGEQEMLHDYYQLRNMLVGLALIILLMGFGLSYFFARSITAKIVYIKNAALEIANGNLDTHIQITSKDEVGLLAQSFATMAEQIKCKQDELILHNNALESINARLHDEINEKNRIQNELNTIQEELELKVEMRTRELKLANEKLYEMSLMDGLTGVANRRYFDEFYDMEWHHAIREKEPLSIIMIDVDHFKLYNDTYGHQGGDDCLRIVGEALRDSLKRDTDLVARYGGEEFVVVLPNTGHPGAIDVAETIRARIESLNIKHSRLADREMVTVSLGLAIGIPGRYLDKKDFLKAADNALYEAKRRGRNRIVIADPLTG